MNEPPNHQTLNHAVYGNGRVLALVCPTSAIEWLCMPRFDSPSVFGRILDAEKGGTFRIDHASGSCTGQMGYVANTNVVRTVFERGEERWEVIDFAPRIPAGLGVRVRSGGAWGFLREADGHGPRAWPPCSPYGRTSTPGSSMDCSCSASTPPSGGCAAGTERWSAGLCARRRPRW